MRLTCDRQELSDAFALAGHVIPTRTTRPILANLRLQAGEGGLEVTATDLEVGLRVRCERLDVEEPGTVLLNAAKAAAILKELADQDQVTIALEDGVATITSGGSVFRMVADDPEEMPEVPAAEEGPWLEVPRAQLEAMIRRTGFAAAEEGLRYALNGVLFEVEPGVLRLVATDGKRLALDERPLEVPEGVQVSRVVSSKAVGLLSRIGGAEDEHVRLRFQENQVLAQTARATLSAQLVQGHFPPYDQVIPKELGKRVELETQPFLAALRKAALLTTRESNAVRFAFGYNKLTLSSRLPGVGEGTVELPIAYEDDPIETAFNPQFVADVLRAIEQPRFALELESATLPCVIREGESYRYVVMPIDIA